MLYNSPTKWKTEIFVKYSFSTFSFSISPSFVFVQKKNEDRFFRTLLSNEYNGDMDMNPIGDRRSLLCILKLVMPYLLLIKYPEFHVILLGLTY